jgi:hypothetical protein
MAHIRVAWATSTRPPVRGSLQPRHIGVREPRALPLAIRGARLPPRRFNRRLVSGMGADESRHPILKSLFVRRTSR